MVNWRIGIKFYVRDKILPWDCFLPAKEMPPGPVQPGERGFLFLWQGKSVADWKVEKCENFVSPEEKRRRPSRSETQVPGAIWAQHFPGWLIFLHNSDFLGLELRATDILEHRIVSISMDVEIMNQGLLGVSKYLKSGCRDGDSLFLGSHMERWGVKGTSHSWGDSNWTQEENFSHWELSATGIISLREVVDS